jgi:hypothetical protein
VCPCTARGRSGLTGHVFSYAVTGGNERSDHHADPCLTSRGCWSKGFYVGSSRDPRGLLCAVRLEDPTLTLERTGWREATKLVPVLIMGYSRSKNPTFKKCATPLIALWYVDPGSIPTHAHTVTYSICRLRVRSPVRRERCSGWCANSQLATGNRASSVGSKIRLRSHGCTVKSRRLHSRSYIARKYN